MVARMTSGNDVFSQVIYNNQGTLRCDEGEAIRDEILLEKMNWFVDGVLIYDKVDKLWKRNMNWAKF